MMTDEEVDNVLRVAPKSDLNPHVRELFETLFARVRELERQQE